jgi:hypothetical protein
MLLLLLSTASCAPLLIGQAALQGAAFTAAMVDSSLTEHNSKLKDSMEAFNHAFRVQNYADASVFVIPDKVEDFWSEARRFKGRIRLMEYKLKDMQLDKETNQATAILDFQYWRMESPYVQTVSCTQKWQYSEKDRAWRVSDSGFEAIPEISY